MPSFQKAFGKLTDPVRTPGIYDFGAMLALPLPEILVGKPPKSNVPTIYTIKVEPNEAGCQVSPDWLPYLLEVAQPEITRSTYTCGFDSTGTQIAPLIIQNAWFPLTEARFFEVVSFPTAPLVSENLTRLIAIPDEMFISENLAIKLRAVDPATLPIMFRRLQYPSVLWHNYEEQKWHVVKPIEMEFDEPSKQGDRVTKVNGVEIKVRAKPVVKKPSFWDMVFPVLQPPLVLGSFENLFLPHDLYFYQPAGIDFLKDNESALLADEMGTGKTVMTIVALKILFQKHKISHALIFSPMSVLQEWNKHLDDWASELVTSFVRGNRDFRQMTWKTAAHVYVTTYDSFREDIDGGLLAEEDLTKFDVVVLDEAQNIKNPTSGRSKAIKKLKARQRWALTGTPIENTILDLVSLFTFLRPGLISRFDIHPGQIKEKINPYFLRRRKANLFDGKNGREKLPEITRQEFWLELDVQQRAEYEQVLSKGRSELAALDRVTKPHIFSIIYKLKRICNFATGNTSSPKAQASQDQIEQIVQSDQKVIVFSQYVTEGIEKLEQVLRSYDCAKLFGEQSQPVRDEQIRKFKRPNKEGGAPILLATVKTGGVGLNLTEASYVIHFDHWWNPATMWQAEARVHRIGQKNTVNIYSYWIRDTIEEKIHNILQRKGLLFKDVVDSLSETQFEEVISTDEWLEMLGVKVKDKVTLPTRSDKIATLSLEEIRQQLLDISPSQFEDVAKELIRCLGYPNPKVTGKSGDGGIDIRASRNTEDGVMRVGAQCKRYRGTVGASAARDFMGAITVEKLTKGFLITTGDFSRDCKWFCEQTGIIVPIAGLEMARYVKDFGIALD